MAKQKRAGKKASGLSVLLDLLDVADSAIEKVTGKGMAGWLKTLQEGNQINQGVPPAQSIANPTDPYAVLGLPATASLVEVKKRYRQLSMIYHPDREGGYTEAMKRVNEAYEKIMTEKEGAVTHGP
jgi:DnaJ-domain-containing protein 1